MRLLKHPLFISAVLLTTINAMLERAGYPVPFVHAYLDDVLCFPVVLTLALTFLRRFVTPRDYTLSAFQVVMAVIYFSIVFEWMLPRVSENYTCDPADIIAYSIGALLFGVFINRSGKSAATSSQAVI